MSIQPRHLLAAITELAANLNQLWPDYQTVEANLARPTLGTPGGDGRSTGIADPTAGIATTHIAYYDTIDNLTTALQHLRLAQRRITLVQRQHAPLARQLEQTAKAARCDGSVDPTCVNNAVRLFRDTNQSLCWRCIKQLQRARETSESTRLSTETATNTTGCTSTAL